MSERGLGLAVLNDSKYGWMARGSQLTLSLLKAPKSPDDTCDMGSHQFKYALMPHVGTLQEAEVVRRGYEFNNPLRLGRDAGDPDASPSWSGLQVAGEGAVLHTVKPCEDGSGDLLLRLFEANGAQTTATSVTERTRGGIHSYKNSFKHFVKWGKLEYNLMKNHH